MKINKINYNVLNKNFEIIEILNEKGFKVEFLNYGATIRSISLNGKILTMSPVCLEDYIQSGPFYGKTVGRYAGRIENASFKLNGIEYNLEPNADGNLLHGGKKTISEKIFNSCIVDEKDYTKIIYSIFDDDSELPGNVMFRIIYTVYDYSNDILVEYEAVGDEDTIINLTNHTYFNLTGDLKKNILDEKLYINASKFTKLKSNMCLDKIEEVNSVMDFRKAKLIGKDIEADFLQNHNTRGYDHCFLLDNVDINSLAVSLVDKDNNLKLDVYTTYPCVVVYTCNYPDTKKVLPDVVPNKYQGICFECQFMPNSINYSDETILRKGNKFSHKTLFEFNEVDHD